MQNLKIHHSVTNPQIKSTCNAQICYFPIPNQQQQEKKTTKQTKLNRAYTPSPPQNSEV